MASLTKHHGGWLVQYKRDGKRKSFYPGKMPRKHALTFTRHIEALESARTQRTYCGDETAAWVARQDLATRQKLHQHGLIEKPAEAIAVDSLCDFTQRYIDGHSGTKLSTRTVWRRCRTLLLAFFGEDRPMDSITVADAKDWREWMLTKGFQRKDREGKGLAENTVRKMCSIAAQFFTDAVDREIVARNPFAHKSIPRTVRESRDRDYFVTRDVAAKVLAACPDAQWQLLFALSRYGGLRCPSEHLSLRLRDILWDQDRIIVTSPKTAHHEGHETRVIPIFPELRPYLDAVWHEAPDRTEFLITRYRSTEANLGTQLGRIIRAAGLKPWPKLWHNLQASRETELTETYPIQTVCAWIGNSPKVAMRHYLTVPDEHFSRAAAPPDAMHYAMQNVTEAKGRIVNSNRKASLKS